MSEPHLAAVAQRMTKAFNKAFPAIAGPPAAGVSIRSTERMVPVMVYHG
jgi:hypothetical protein